MLFPNDIIPAKAIWMNPDRNKDEYADFYPQISFKDGKNYRIRIVCDTDKAIYIDNKLISFGHYADYPSTPVYEDIDLPASAGNILKITVWHSGVDSQTHVATDAYVAFCIYENDIPVYSSSEETLVHPSPEYIPHLCKIITTQMGAGFSLTGRSSAQPLDKAYIKNMNIDSLRKRPIKALTLSPCINAQMIKSGTYSFTVGNDTAEKMTNVLPDTCDNPDGCYFIFDLGKEYVGFPEISFTSQSDCDLLIGWGEHITDGLCRTAIHSRRFTTEILAKSGDNHYFPVLRRLGLRYLQMFFTSTDISNVSLKFHPVNYPVKSIDKSFANNIRNAIWNTSIHTLKCCMHEHYEDCPWREQALYTLDSRNQMLAGYEVFENKNAEYVRANLDLISRGVREDGILALCYPAGLDYPIPFYTLAYIIQMDEYIQNTADISLASEKYNILCNLLDTFFNRSSDGGLIKRFPDAEGYWNFYEWSKNLSGNKIHLNTPKDNLPFEAIISAALSIAARSMANICRALNKKSEEKAYSEKSSHIADLISVTFYNKETKLFFDFTDRPDIQPSVLTQAMCILCGAADSLPKEIMLEAIANNGGQIGNIEVIPATLSMACFRYDALLKTDKDKYKNIILGEIDRDGLYMLNNGATTFWETLKGEADFGGAGSLCHGWSAMAAYYYSKLL